MEVDSDPYIRMEVSLPRGPNGQLEHATVKRGAIDKDGKPYGVALSTPLLDTSTHEIEYLDVKNETLSANIITENILSQVNKEGHRQMMLDEIIDHSTTKNVAKKENGFYFTKSGSWQLKITTQGWALCIQWKDRLTNWVALKYLKTSYPVELADYAVNNNIHEKPTFI